MVEKILRTPRDQLHNLYLVHSQEKVLLDNFLQNYLTRFVPVEERAFNLNMLDIGENWFGHVKNVASTLPVMAPYRQLVLRCGAMKGEDWKDLDNYLPRLPETTRILILCHGHIDGRLKIIKTIKEGGFFFPLSLAKGKELQAMIGKRFQQEGLKISKGAILLLESSFAGDLGRLGQEIKKVALYCTGEGVVSEKDLKEIMSRDVILADTAIFQLVDLVGRKETGKALELLQEMLLKGEGEIYVLTMIARQFRLILLSKDLDQEELNPFQIAKRLKEHSYPIKKALVQSRNFSFLQLERILCRIYEANLHIVTGRFKPSLALEILLLDLKGIE